MTTVRSKIVAAARWGIANEPRIHYGELRPVPFGRRLPLTTDCSGFVTLCYYLAGAPDPNGLGYSGQGWTGTLLDNQPRTRRLHPGDVVVWGAYPGRHCAIVLEPGRDPLLASHGQERGPVAIRYSAECKLQPAEIAWLGLVEGLDAAHRRDEDGAAEPEDDRPPIRPTCASAVGTAAAAARAAAIHPGGGVMQRQEPAIRPAPGGGTSR